MSEHDQDVLFLCACLLGLALASLGHSYLYRRLRSDVDFLIVVNERRIVDV